MLHLRQVRFALIIGAGKGLGLSLVEALAQKSPEAQIYATYRDAKRAAGLLALAEKNARIHTLEIDPTEETSLALLAQNLKDSPLDLILIATGFLHDANRSLGPERSVREISLEGLLENFRVNSCITPLVAKHCAKLLHREAPTAFVALSARVGSIDDNQLGGWYGYRASKAALNMFIKTLSIELARTVSPYLSVMAIHPGTTETDLSKPFLKHVKHEVFQPAQAAQKILATIESAQREGTGLFKNFDGTNLPW